jgi:broad specificity phosphatase PhoE
MAGSPRKTPFTFYFARHCESKWNCASKEERAKGDGLRDAALSALGLRQAARIEKELGKIEELKKVTVVLSSPLTRALQTAKSISTALGGVPIKVNEALREVRRDVSDLGSHYDDLVKDFPYTQYRGIENLRPWWWLNARASAGASADCKCLETSECDPCVTSRLFKVRDLITSLPDEDVPLLVSHHDFIKEFIGRELANGEVMRVHLDA